jgi:FlaA1/EpsC-like NDP-sugar epimerase
MKKDLIELILDRPEAPLDIAEDLRNLSSARVLITGGKGSLGQEVARVLDSHGIKFKLTDIEECDVTDKQMVLRVFNEYRPTHVLHLAADKHAPEGELHPETTFKINTSGSMNVIAAADEFKAIVTLASTCKSCDPETAYGASKLIAERITLNHGGTVARFYNVVDTAGNVFEIWNKLGEEDDIQVAECYRYFISAAEATSLLIKSMSLSTTSSGRYIFDPGISHYMPDIAARIYPKRRISFVPPRRGDRRVEPQKAESERLNKVIGRLIKVSSPHDPNDVSFQQK